MPKSIYLADKVNDHAVGGGDYTRPATLYFALFTTMPTGSGGGTEASGGTYARVSKTNNATNFPASSNRQKTNGTDIDWGTLSVALGTILGAGIYDAASGGNLLYYELFTSPQTIYAGNTFKIPAGSMVLTET